ncbi:hypothetical protein Pla108_15440 [Botrimarina colliarenosi]|uniref:Uncharacterized protein n=1 Tax=Botrimarina colliarenosi TaxID=2528001 RepID=A0A5C6ANK3_9BACT|nr:hypothetical protein [Botrimarina colliarenosi]TWU00592.1 hypothetical protein Pla108_15440 [Botrimarina colliarenosi]
MSLSRTLLLAAACFTLVGCQKKETVVDVKSPLGDVEVVKDTATGDVSVDVDAENE